MAPPKALTGELAKLFRETFEAVEKRTTPLTEEGAKSLQRLSPEAQVAMDELLGGGAKLGEVQGTGTGSALANMHPDPTLTPAAEWNTWAGPKQETTPFKPERGYGQAGRYGEHIESMQQEASGPMMGPIPAEQRFNVLTAQMANVDANTTERLGSLFHENQGAGWPLSWHKAENIPGIAAGAGLTGAALLARPAQAQEQPELQGDDFTPDPVGAATQDDFVADDFTPDDWQADLQVEVPASLPVPQPVRPPGQFAPYLPGVQVQPQTELPMSVGPGAAPAPKYGVGDALAETGKQTWTAIKAGWAPVQTMADHLVAPVVRASQGMMRDIYFGGDDPTYIAPGQNRKAGGIGGWLRENSPDDALVAENLGKLFIGPTEGNTPATSAGSEWTRKGVEKIEAEFGPTGTAVFLGLMHAIPNGAVAMIPGFGQAGTVTEIATAGAISGMIDPESGSVAEQATMGLAGAGVLKAAAKPAGKAWKALLAAVQEGGAREARAAGFFPVAVVPPERTAEFADTIVRMAQQSAPVIPSKEAPVLSGPSTNPGRPAAIRKAGARPPPLKDAPIVSVVDAHANVHVFEAGPEGVKARTLAPGTRPPKGVPVLADSGAREVLAEPGTKAAVDIARKLSPNDPLVDRLIPPPAATFEQGRNMLLDSMPDWDANAALGDLKEGGVIVLEGGGGDGAARLYDVTDPGLQLKVLERRNLVKVKTPDGRWEYGFLDETTGIVRSPEPEELIPNALQEDIQLTDADVDMAVAVGKQEKKLLLESRQQRVEQQKATQARNVADLSAQRATQQIQAQQIAQAQQAQVQHQLISQQAAAQGLPPPPPPPVPPAQPPGLPPAPPNVPGGGVPTPPPNPHNVMPTTGVAVQYTNSIFSRFKNKLLNPTVRGPIDLAEQAIAAHSVDSFEGLRKTIFERLNKLAPETKRMTPSQLRQTHEDITRFLEGHINLQQLEKAQPTLKRAIFEQLEARKVEIRTDSEELKRLGMVSDDALEDELGPDAEYLIRSYWRHMMPDGEWAKLAKQDAQGMRVLQDAIQRDVYSQMGLAPAEQAARAKHHLDLLLGDKDALEAARLDPEGAWRKMVSKAGGSLKERQTMAWWKKAALGEVDNAFVRIAESQARQKQLILQGRMWEQVANNPKWSTAGDDYYTKDLVGHTKQVPAQRKYGMAAGRWVAPEVWESLVQVPQAQKNASTWVSSVLNSIKYGQTVGNPGSWVTNFVANGQGAAMSNLVNPFSSPYKIGAGMVGFVQDLGKHKQFAGIAGADVQADRFSRAMELGIVGSDYSSAEFHEAAGLWKKALEREQQMNGGKVNWLQMTARMARDAAVGGKEGLARYYGAVDSMWKYSTYLSGLEKFGVNLATGKLDEAKAIAALSPSYWQEIVQGPSAAWAGSRYRPGMTSAQLMQAVEVECAQRIHYAFPMLDRVGEGVAVAGKWGGTVINPYLKITFELMRNYAQLVPRTLKEKGMAANLMGYGAIAGGTYFAIKKLRESQGISQKEVDEAYAGAPSHIQKFKPGAMALPVRSANGRLLFVDLTSLFQPFSWMQGNPDTELPLRMLTGMAMSPIDGSLLEEPLADQLATAGVQVPGFQSRTPPEWQQGGAKLLTQAALKYGPGLLRNTYQTAQRGGDSLLGMQFEQQGIRGPRAATTPQGRGVTTANYLLGPNRFFEAGGPGEVGEAERQRAIQLKAQEITAAGREMQRIGAMNEGQSTGLGTAPLNKQEALKKQRDIINQKQQELDLLKSKLGK